MIEGMQNVCAAVADKAFDAVHLLERIGTIGVTAVIPPTANRNEVRRYGTHVYKNRNLIERFFARIKRLPRIATHYDKLAVRFEAFISIVAPSI